MSIKKIVDEKMGEVERIIGNISNTWHSEQAQRALDQAKGEIVREAKSFYDSGISDLARGKRWMLWVVGITCLTVGLGIGYLLG